MKNHKASHTHRLDQSRKTAFSTAALLGALLAGATQAQPLGTPENPDFNIQVIGPAGIERLIYGQPLQNPFIYRVQAQPPDAMFRVQSLSYDSQNPPNFGPMPEPIDGLTSNAGIDYRGITGSGIVGGLQTDSPYNYDPEVVTDEYFMTITPDFTMFSPGQTIRTQTWFGAYDESMPLDQQSSQFTRTRSRQTQLITNRTITGSADIDAGRHMWNQPIGQLVLNGGGLDNDAATKVTVKGTDSLGYALHDNGLLFQSANTGDRDFNSGSNSTIALEIYQYDLGSYDHTPSGDGQLTLPSTSTRIKADGSTQISYGGHWTVQGQYKDVLGNDVVATEGGSRVFGPSLDGFTPTLGGGSSDDTYYRVEGDESTNILPETVTLKDPIRTAIKVGENPTLAQRQFSLIEGEVLPGSSLDLSNVTVAAKGTSLDDRSLSSPRVSLGRFMANTGTIDITRTDITTITTHGDDDTHTRLSLDAFDLSVEVPDGSGGTIVEATASHAGPATFDSADDTSEVNLSANFTINTNGSTGLVDKTFNIADKVSTSENGGLGLAGQQLPTSLSVGYQYNVVENNDATSRDVVLVALEGDTINGSFFNGSVRQEEVDSPGLNFSSTHTNIGLDRSYTVSNKTGIATGSLQFLQREILDADNGRITGEGLAGEVVSAETTYDVDALFVKAAQLNTTPTNESLGSEPGDQIVIENVDATDGFTKPQAFLAINRVARQGSSRWTVEPQAWDGSGLQAGTEGVFDVVFDDTGIVIGSEGLGRSYRTTIEMDFENSIRYSDYIGFLPSGVEIDVVTNTELYNQIETRTWLLERVAGVTASSGSASFAAGANLRDEGVNLTFDQASFATPTSASILDSEALGVGTTVNMGFATLNDVDEQRQQAEGFDELISDVLEVDGLNNVLHVLQVNYQEPDPEDPDAIDERYHYLSWFDAGDTETTEDDAWVHAILGNSDIDSYELETETSEGTVTVGGQEIDLEDFLRQRNQRMSYNDYLAGVGSPVLGDFGIDIEANEVWAVIDHNSSFATSTPEPGSLTFLLLGGLGLLRRRRSSRII